MKRTSYGWYALLLFAALVGTGCADPALESSRTDEPATKVAERPERREHPPKAAAISLAECYQFAIDLEVAIRAEDVNRVNELMNWNAMFDVATAGYEVAQETRTRFVNQHRGQAEQGDLFGVNLSAIRKGATYSAIRVRFDRESTAVWFRLKYPNGAIFYTEYRLGRGSDGTVQACDIYCTSAGESLGEMMRPLYTTMLKYNAEGSLENLTPQQKAIVKHHDNIKRIRTLTIQGDHAGVVALYHTFPEEVQRLKSVILARVDSAAEISPEEVHLAVHDAERFYGAEGSLDSTLSDYYYRHGRFQEALACIDRLNWRVGGDIYLSEQRVTILIKANRLRQARQEASLILCWAPNMLVGYRAILNVSLAEHDFERTLKILEVLTENGYQCTDLTQDPVYADFVKSPQYEKWQRKQQVAQQPESEAEYSAWPRQL